MEMRSADLAEELCHSLRPPTHFYHDPLNVGNGGERLRHDRQFGELGGARVGGGYYVDSLIVVSFI